MALGATVHHLEIALSDVDRAVYETLDLRVAQHPSETPRFLVTRVLAYCLSYADGIAFSKGGLSSTDEPPLSIHDPTGVLVAWIDVGVPTAERLHKASKAARKVAVFTTEPAQLRRATEGKCIHLGHAIEVFALEPSFVDAIVAALERKSRLEVTRNDGHLYVAVGGASVDAPLVPTPLVPESDR